MATKAKQRTAKAEQVAVRSKKQTEAVAPSAEADKEMAKRLAKAALRPSVNAAAIMCEYGKPIGAHDVNALIDSLLEAIDDLKTGNMERCENMLMAQAYALQTIFMNFSRRALTQDYQHNLEAFFRMGLKAQNQCRMTLETLATIKNPPIVYARQANVTTGPQQVNNGIPAPSRAREIETEQTQLSKEKHELLPDTRTSGNAGGIDKEMETLGKIDRAEVRRR
jgi:hypothetical protein